MRNYFGIMVCCGLIFSVFTGCNSTTGGGSSELIGGTANKKMPNGGEVNGPRSIENVEKNMAILMPRLEHFYAKILKENPEFQGSIELLFDVDAKGTVIYVNMGKSTFKDPVFVEEVLTALSNHRFDAWDGGNKKTEVIYPLAFFPPKKEIEKKETSEENETIENEESTQ